jgi:translocation and assembly module TamB
VIGAPGSFHLKGPLGAGSVVELVRGLDLLATLNLNGADIYGLKVGPIPLTVRTQAGRLVIDPIRTSLNGGRLALDPEIDRDDQGRVTIRLKPGSAIENAEVNDEVSRRFLSYAAPVLDRATRARGLISARITRAEFPLGAGASRSAVVEGDVVFQNVEFAPGPLATDLLALIGRSDATLKLDQPIVLSIAGGKVHQHGLALPIGRLTRIEVDGTVDFERNLDLIVSIPLRPEGVGPELVPGGLIPGHRITIPVRGTLDRPQIDREAFLADLKEFGQRLGFGAGRAAIGLIERLARPRDPEAMPRLLTPEERKARRLERRAQRQRGVGP